MSEPMAPEGRRIPEPAAHKLDDDGLIPNNPALPLLVYAGAWAGAWPLPGDDPADACAARFRAHGWRGTWINGIYDFPHYHSTAHEALAVARGWADVRLGSDAGLVLRASAGDVLVLPAGTGHQNLGASPDLLVVGAYPPGPDWDLCRARPEERQAAIARIREVPLPLADPVTGGGGPLLRLWSGAASEGDPRPPGPRS